MDDEQRKHAEQMMKSLAARAIQQDNEEFLAWLKEGDKAKEKRGKLRELYDFVRWVSRHNALIIEVSSDEIVAGDVDTPEEYRFQPDGGLSVQHWPYLHDLVRENVERDEIITAILENELKKTGRSGAAAFRAVEEKITKVEKAGFAFWSAVETQGFQAVIEEVDAHAAQIDQEWESHRKELEAVPPQKKTSKYQFRLEIDVWRFRFPGDRNGEEGVACDEPGLGFHHRLLIEHSNPQTIDDLLPGRVDETAEAGKGLTEAEINAKKRKIEKLRAEADDAEKSGDYLTAMEKREDAENLEQQLMKDTALFYNTKHPKPRPIKLSPKQKDRHWIKTAMKRARGKLRDHGMYHLADHLEKYCEPPYGGDWCYEPEVLPDWELG